MKMDNQTNKYTKISQKATVSSIW